MPFVITSPCADTRDASCVAVCPVDCIHPTPDSPEFASATQLYVDPDGCIDCGACEQECPIQAIFPDSDVPAQWLDAIDANRAYFDR